VSDWRAAFRRIGGPDAVSWPAFWATLVANLVGHFGGGGQVDAPTWARLLALLTSQVVMFIPLVALRLTLLRDPEHPRPWVALAGFAITPVVRTAVLVGMLVVVGGLEQPQWLQRTLSAFPSQFLVLLVTAVVVGSLREQARTLRRLRQVQQNLARTQAQVQLQVRERNEAALGRVRATLEIELSRIAGASEQDAVQHLQALATDVVRPMSHDLARSVPSWTPPIDPVPSERLDRRQMLAGLAERPPFLPGVSALLMTLIVMGGAFSTLGGIRVVLLLSSSVGVYLALRAANLAVRILPRSTPGQSFGSALLAALLTSAVPATIDGIVLGGPAGVVLAVGGTVFIAGIAMMAALIRAALWQRKQAEQALRASTDSLRVHLARLHQLQWYQHKALSRALHGPMQSAATAAALRMDAAVRAGLATPDLVDEVRTALLRQVDVLGMDEPEALPLQEVLDRVMGTWEGLCEVTVNAGSQVRSILDDDPVLRAIVVEILSEAVSNAVRHGWATQVQVWLALESEQTVSVFAVDNGEQATSDRGNGLGSRLLDECTLRWSREATGSGHTLEALLPLDPASAG